MSQNNKIADGQIAAIILASGASSRFGGNTPKPYVLLENGRSILAESISKFIGLVDYILPVIRPEDQGLYNSVIKEFRESPEILPPCFGGATRRQSTLNGLKALENLPLDQIPNLVLIHDAARPFIATETIEQLITELKSGTQAISPVAKITDTIRKIDAKGNFLETLNRTELVAMQTPQGFDFQTILAAHHKADSQIHAGDLNEESLTDDIEIAQLFGIKTKYLVNNPENIKITYPSDL